MGGKFDATGYIINVGTTPGGVDVANGDDMGTATSFTVPAPDPSTTYYATVFPYNANGTATGCTESSFTTCDAVTAPYTEGFENAGTLPGCWNMSGSEDWKFSNTGSGNHIGNNGTITGTTTSGNYFAWIDDSSPDTANATLTSPFIDASALTSPRLTFYELSNNEGNSNSTLNVEVWDGAAWNAMASYNTNTIGGWEKKVIDLSTLTITGNIQVRFTIIESSSFYDDIAIDDVTIEETPACLEPTMFTVTAVATDNVTVSWTAGASETQWEYVIQALGTGAPTGAGISTTNNPLTITGLTSNTSYEIYLRAVCSVADQSVWVGPFNLTTACDATNVPYLMDFETATVPALPNCTAVVNAGAGNVWNTVSSPGSGFTTNTLRYPYNSANAANTWFFTQGVNLTAGTSYRISYDYGNNSTTYEESLNVAYGSSADAASMTNAIASHPTINTGALQSNVVDFTPTATGVYYFGFQATSIADQFNLYVDNINVILTPACSEPLGLAVSNLTDTAADVSWTATTGSYEYVLDAVATDPAGAGTALTGEAYNATGLTPSTTYYFHVRTVCAGPTYSVWSTKMFTTLATPPVNDNCSAAQVLTPGGVFADQAVVGTNVGATDSGETAPTCASYQGGDVWYSVTVPASGNITIESDINTGTAITDTGLAVYSGSCGALTQVGCSDDDGNGNFSKVSLTGRTPGEVLLVSVWEYGGGTDGTFQVSAYDASLSSNSFDNASFAAYPNPVKDVFNVSYSSEISSIRVLNLLGQEVITKQVNATSTQIDMSPLSAGAYIVNVAVGDAIKTIKVVKQ